MIFIEIVLTEIKKFVNHIINQKCIMNVEYLKMTIKQHKMMAKQYYLVKKGDLLAKTLPK